mmetsp:Transcript_3460/g.10593  ORF Transcript_3460/g.10593 Transcript_3460/m.10593 type:complete len:265 (+) Transcript_3460:1805-2599(+)
MRASARPRRRGSTLSSASRDVRKGMSSRGFASASAASECAAARYTYDSSSPSASTHAAATGCQSLAVGSAGVSSSSSSSRRAVSLPPPRASKNSDNESRPSQSRSKAARSWREEKSTTCAGKRAQTTNTTSFARASKVAYFRTARRMRLDNAALGASRTTTGPEDASGARSAIQASRNALSAVKRRSTSRSRRRATNSRACGETLPKSRVGNVSLALATRARISRSVRPPKGGAPESSMYAIIPRDHRSQRASCAPRRTSGATK